MLSTNGVQVSERIARLYGPALVSTDPASPTTLFTVPTGELYVVRSMTMAAPLTMDAQSVTGLVGVNGISLDDIVLSNGLTTSVTSAGTSLVTTAMPFTEGEAAKAYIDGFGTAPTRLDYFSSNSSTWNTVSSTDAATLASATFTPQAMNVPANVYFISVTTKATTPDAITSITDAHTNPPTGMASVLSAVGATVRADIWAGYMPVAPSALQPYTINWGGTWTAAFIDAITVQGTAVSGSTPSTSNILLQTATATGTTELSQGVTMTPTNDKTCQLLLVGCNGANSSYTGPSNSTELNDQGSGGAPLCTAAAYLIAPSVSNPAATIAGAGTSWAAACIEIPYAGLASMTLAGIIID